MNSKMLFCENIFLQAPRKGNTRIIRISKLSSFPLLYMHKDFSKSVGSEMGMLEESRCILLD